jgi:hypothetical protein
MSILRAPSRSLRTRNAGAEQPKIEKARAGHFGSAVADDARDPEEEHQA